MELSCAWGEATTRLDGTDWPGGDHRTSPLLRRSAPALYRGTDMRVLAAADIHGEHNVYRWLADVACAKNVDALVLAGDLLGGPPGFATIQEAQREDAREMVRALQTWGGRVFYIMGNDDMVDLESPDPRFQMLHSRRIELGGVAFVGYPYSLPFMGGVYEKPEEKIEFDLATLEPLLDDRTVFITHSPAYGTLDTVRTGEPAGSRAICSAIERRNVLAHFHGHIHGRFGRQGRHFNVASARARRAMLIELPGLEHEILDHGDSSRLG